MADPRVYVQFDLTVPYGTAWVEITTDVEELDISRGRSYEFDRFEPGELNMTLNNASGDYTPGRVGSPYYPYVRPKRPIKAEITEGGITYPLFAGLIEKWPVEILTGSSQVQVSAVETFASLNGAELKRPSIEYFRAAKPKHYFPLSEEAGATSAANWGSRPEVMRPQYAKGGGLSQFGTAGIGKYGEGSVGLAWEGATTTTTSAGVFAARLAMAAAEAIPMTATRTFMYEVTSVNSATGSLPSPVLYLETPADSTLWVTTLSMDFAANTIQLFMRGFAIASVTLGSNVSIGDKFIFQISVNSSNQAVLNVARLGNGKTAVEFKSAASTLPVDPLATFRVYLGSVFNVTDTGGRFSHLSINYDGPGETGMAALTPSVSDLSALLFAKVPVTEVTYLNRVAGMLGTTVTADPAKATLDPPDWAEGVSGTEPLSIAAESAGGVFFINASGSATYHNRDRNIATAPVFTFDCAGATFPETGLKFLADDDRVINDVTVTAGGSDRHVEDAASVEEYDRLSTSIETYLSNPIDGDYLAQWRLYLTKDSVVRCDDVTVNMTTFPDKTLFGIDFGDRIRLANLPDQAPASSLDFIVEGIKWTFEPDGEVSRQTAVLSLSPAAKLDIWVLEDASLGLLDDTTILSL